ncbi:MAG: FAD:protein FMN transferase [Clostridia bacterium]|nr:FAD:protein FMN transferase [Clostridia bacterium]
MKKRQLLALLLATAMLSSCFLLFSCGKQKNKYSEYSLDYFDTATAITGYADSQEEFDEVSRQILDELAEYHRLYTVYHRYEGLENLYTVNELENGAHRTVTVDRRIIDLLLYSKEMYQKTNGMVNVAMGSVLSIWHDYREAGRNEPWTAELPPREMLEEAAKHTRIEDLIIDETNNTVHLADPEMKLDVGAIAKGYAVEMIAQGLEKRGITGYVLNVGGNVRTVGMRGDGKKWTVGIENPAGTEDEPYLAYLGLAGESLITSGTYQRYYMVGNQSYHHIIDPETLMPAEGYQSISVVCKSSADGDALSTALFCMSLDEGKDLVRSLDGVEVHWNLSDGTRVTSDGFERYLISISDK